MNFLIIKYEDGKKIYINTSEIRTFEVAENGKTISRITVTNNAGNAYDKLFNYEQKSWELI